MMRAFLCGLTLLCLAGCQSGLPEGVDGCTRRYITSPTGAAGPGRAPFFREGVPTPFDAALRDASGSPVLVLEETFIPPAPIAIRQSPPLDGHLSTLHGQMETARKPHTGPTWLAQWTLPTGQIVSIQGQTKNSGGRPASVEVFSLRERPASDAEGSSGTVVSTETREFSRAFLETEYLCFDRNGAIVDMNADWWCAVCRCRDLWAVLRRRPAVEAGTMPTDRAEADIKRLVLKRDAPFDVWYLSPYP